MYSRENIKSSDAILLKPNYDCELGEWTGSRWTLSSNSNFKSIKPAKPAKPWCEPCDNEGSWSPQSACIFNPTVTGVTCDKVRDNWGSWTGNDECICENLGDDPECKECHMFAMAATQLMEGSPEYDAGRRLDRAVELGRSVYKYDDQYSTEFDDF